MKSRRLLLFAVLVLGMGVIFGAAAGGMAGLPASMFGRVAAVNQSDGAVTHSTDSDWWKLPTEASSLSVPQNSPDHPAVTA